MTTTWNEIRVSSLQKMFLIQGAEVVENDSTISYLNAMPSAYNEGARLISTNNRFIVKVYEVECDGENDVIIDLKVDIPDLYRVLLNSLYIEQDGELKRISGYRTIGGKLYLPAVEGKYMVQYYAYPLKVTNDTKGDTVLDLDDDVASLIPLYIASELYKEDDISIATMYRNQFESAREMLVGNPNASTEGKIISVTGWW